MTKQEKRDKCQKVEKVLVSPDFLEKIFEKIACASLNMHDPTMSSAEIFHWRGKAWVATDGTSYKQKAERVEIQEVVPAVLWDRPYNDINKSGPDFYLGGRFYPKGKPKETWVMTGNYLDLFPDPDASPVLVQQLLI